MMQVIRFEDLGKGDFGWLKARYHFSFARYYNPGRMGFGILRVVNDDRVAAGAGFDPHPHRDMEIITYVRQGEIRHRDSLGHEGVTPAGSVQVMSAGTGIAHAEYASETEQTVLYQIWIEPREQGVAPRWDLARFPQEFVIDQLRLLVSGRAEDTGAGALMIHADAALYGGRMAAGHVLAQDFGARAYVLVSEGDVRIQGQLLHAGDALAVDGEGPLTFEAVTDAELVVIALPEGDAAVGE